MVAPVRRKRHREKAQRQGCVTRVVVLREGGALEVGPAHDRGDDLHALPRFYGTRRDAIADDEGRYRFVVPYPTDVRFSPDVTVPRSYRIISPNASGTLDIREQTIRVAGTSDE